MTVDLLPELVPAKDPTSLEVQPQNADGSFEISCIDCGRHARVSVDRPFVHAPGCTNA